MKPLAHFLGLVLLIIGAMITQGKDVLGQIPAGSSAPPLPAQMGEKRQEAAEHKTLLEIETDQMAFLERPVILTGTLEMSTFYGGGYQNAQETHYAFMLREQPSSPRFALVFMRRGEASATLRKRLLDHNGKIDGSFTIVVLKERYKVSSLLVAELIDYALPNSPTSRKDVLGQIPAGSSARPIPAQMGERGKEAAEHKTLLEVETDQMAFLERPVILTGTLEMGTLYGGGYQNAQETHYAFMLREQPSSPRFALVLMRRGEASATLRKLLLDHSGKLAGSFTIVVLKERYKASSLLVAELIDYALPDSPTSSANATRSNQQSTPPVVSILPDSLPNAANATQVTTPRPNPIPKPRTTAENPSAGTAGLVAQAQDQGIRIEYDKFKDETSVFADLSTIAKDLQLNLGFSHAGQKPIKPTDLQKVTLIFKYSASEHEEPFKDNTELEVIVSGGENPKLPDGTRAPLKEPARWSFGSMSYERRGSDNPRVFFHWLWKGIPYELVVKIATAKKVEMRLGGKIEFELTDEQLKELREFISYGSTPSNIESKSSASKERGRTQSKRVGSQPTVPTGSSARSIPTEEGNNEVRVSQIITQAEDHFRKGKRNLDDSKRDAARDEFDKAVDTVLESGLDVRATQRLQTFYLDLVERIYREEVPIGHGLPRTTTTALIAQNVQSPTATQGQTETPKTESTTVQVGLRDQKFQPSPLDELSKLVLTPNEQKVSPTTAKRPSDKARENKCTLTIDQSPIVRGLRLGQPLAMLVELFPNYGVSLRPDPNEIGLSETHVIPGLLGDEQSLKGIEWIELRYLDGKLASIAIDYDDTVSWQSNLHFTAAIAEQLHLPVQGWLYKDPSLLTCDGLFVVTSRADRLRIERTDLAVELRRRQQELDQKRRRDFKP